MTWFKVDDGFWSHPKTMTLSESAVALWVRAGAYCCQHLTDGLVPPGSLRMLGEAGAADELVAAGLWDATDSGYQFHDWGTYQPSRESVMADRASNAARQAVARNPALRDAIRGRDGNRCRYCNVDVEWNNRRGGDGGTYDHVNPNGGSTLENLVVCCRACNSRKGRRTPRQAGMTLIQLGSKSDTNPTNKAELDGPGDVRAPRPDPTFKKKRSPAKPDESKPKAIEQATAEAAYERVGKAFNFMAVRQIIKWAIHERGDEPRTVEDACVAVHELGKPITKQTVAQYLDGRFGGKALHQRDPKSGMLVER